MGAINGSSHSWGVEVLGLGRGSGRSWLVGAAAAAVASRGGPAAATGGRNGGQGEAESDVVSVTGL